jgi:UDP:flavonoid glycosyltransferase YjiC (YdhE family)
MRILFTSTAGLGHLLPLLPLAAAAAAAGHSVVVSTPAHNADRVRARGLAWHDLLEPTQAQRDEVRSRAGSEEEAGVQIFGRLNPAAALPGIEALVRDWRPDLLVSEGGEFASSLAAERAGLPLVRVHPGMVFGNLWERLVEPALSASRTDIGLAADPLGDRLITVPQLSYFPAEFDREPHSPFVTRVRRPGLPRPAGDRKPLIYVTFGSEIPGMPMFAPTVGAAVAAARQTGCRIVLAVGSADPRRLGDLTGVDVASWVDQSEVLPRARAVISHGGAGTTLDALAAGTPTIAVPFFADQPINAERLHTTGTGIAVPPGPDLTDRLADALDSVLAEKPSGCAPMAAAVHGLPDVEEGVALLERTARTLVGRAAPAGGPA